MARPAAKSPASNGTVATLPSRKWNSRAKVSRGSNCSSASAAAGLNVQASPARLSFASRVGAAAVTPEDHRLARAEAGIRLSPASQGRGALAGSRKTRRAEVGRGLPYQLTTAVRAAVSPSPA